MASMAVVRRGRSRNAPRDWDTVAAIMGDISPILGYFSKLLAAKNWAMATIGGRRLVKFGATSSDDFSRDVCGFFVEINLATPTGSESVDSAAATLLALASRFDLAENPK